MAKEVYVEVANKAKNSKKAHIGVEDISRKILKGYIGDDDGIARMFFQGGEIILPPSVGEVSYTGEDLIYNSWNDSANNYLICKKLGDFIFISSNNYTGVSSNGQKLNGLYVVNMKTSTLTQITTSGHTYTHAIELKENRYLVSNSSGNIFLYNGETETATSLSIGTGFNHKIDVGNKVLIRSQSTSADLYLYDKTSETFTSLGLPLHDILETSQGIFAFASFGTSSSYMRVYKFNAVSETFEEVIYYTTANTTSSITADLTQRMYEDRYGGIWICSNAESATPHVYDGTYFSAKWEDASTSPNFAYLTPPIFKLGDDECFIVGGKVWAFSGNTIKSILSTVGQAKYTSTVPVHIVKNERVYIVHDTKTSSSTARWCYKFLYLEWQYVRI